MHNISHKNNKHSFFSVKEKAWHGLGTVLDKCPTSEEAIKIAGLDYEVKLAPIYAQLVNVNREIAKHNDTVIKDTNSNEGTYFNAEKIENKFATYRADTNDVFGIVGNRYEILQNTKAFKFFDDIVGKGEAIYETAGSLGNGETIFITAKLPDYIHVQNHDIIEKYLLLTTSHDGTSSTQIMFTPVRVVCNNTLQLAVNQSGKSKYSVRHTASASENLKKVIDYMGIVNMYSKEMEVVYNNMSKTFIKENEVSKYFDMIFLTSDEMKELASGTRRDRVISSRKMNTINNVYKFYNEGIGQDEITTRGTLFGAYNAVTGYYQNVKSFNNETKRFNNLLNGRAYNTSQKALDIALPIINNTNILS